MRRAGVVLIAFAFAAPTAGAATIHKYAGHAIVPPRLPTKSALADLNDSANTLVELDRVGAPMAAAALCANGARLIAPQLDLWSVSSLRAQRILPSLMRLGLVRSVTPDRKVHLLRATNPYTDPPGPYQWRVRCIAIDHGRGVITLSLGSESRIFQEEETMMAAFGTGSLIVVAAGNEREKGSPIEYPASYPHILTVGATDENDNITVFSNRSPYMDLSAPGQDIPAAIPISVFADGYSSVDGTSFSTPLTAGAAASVW